MYMYFFMNFIFINILMFTVFSSIFIEVRGMPERDIGSLGAMGKGAGCGQEILPPPPSSSPSSPTPKWVFDELPNPSFSDT